MSGSTHIKLLVSGMDNMGCNLEKIGEVSITAHVMYAVSPQTPKVGIREEGSHILHSEFSICCRLTAPLCWCSLEQYTLNRMKKYHGVNINMLLTIMEVRIFHIVMYMCFFICKLILSEVQLILTASSLFQIYFLKFLITKTCCKIVEQVILW